jgi:hypothetical protein
MNVDELIILGLGLATLLFALGRRGTLRSFPAVGLLSASYAVLLAGWVLTNLEGLFLGEVLNTAEHACYGLSALLMALWSWRVFEGRGGGTG